MTEEKLNKMKWLHEQGFVPNMFWNTGVISDTRMDFRGLGLSVDNDIPYFTESKLWSLLPDRVRAGEFSDAIVIYELVAQKCYKSPLFSLAYEAIFGGCLHEIESDDLHTALLDMVIWCVENKYLKAEEK